jgi:hypothetical protein
VSLLRVSEKLFERPLLQAVIGPSVLVRAGETEGVPGVALPIGPAENEQAIGVKVLTDDPEGLIQFVSAFPNVILNAGCRSPRVDVNQFVVVVAASVSHD